ncbi:MAG: YiiD C-terminal domain-containing protein [Planctomycetota bacterium]|jgi:acyl-coenzyme A thioesterase PaaI-like protein
MDVTQIPFVEKVGVVRSTKGSLELPFNKTIQNHLQTIHASAQFALAETASGEILQTIFPELVGKVAPVLRESQIRFKKPATNTISAQPTVSDEAISKFREQFKRKGRSSISVNVEIKDSESVVTCVGTFKWFVQSVDQVNTTVNARRS